MTDAPTPEFEEFWEASNYSLYNVKEFAAAQELFSAKDKTPSLLEYPGEPKQLRLPKTKLNRVTKNRKSGRSFGPKPLSQKELSVILSSFYAANDTKHRSCPSAGASYALEIFCVANNITGLKHKITLSSIWLN